MENPTAYDFRLYDQVWRQGAPYGDIAAAQREELSVPTQTNEDSLPGAERNPCCMGTEAAESLGVLEGFIEEELAQRRCYLALAQRACHAGAARLLREAAAGKQAAAQSLKTAYFLITGTCYNEALGMERMRWSCLSDALRTVYHQEACNGFNYARASDETVDSCLQKLFARLSQEAFDRADAVMALLSRLLC